MKLPLMLSSLFATTALIAGGLPDGPYIYTVGNSAQTVDPDTASLKITVVDTSPAIGTAKGEVAKRTASILKTLKECAVSEEDIDSHDVSVASSYDYVESKGRVFTGYAVTQLLNVEIFPLNHYEEIINHLLADNVSSFTVTSVRNSRETEIEKSLIETAIRDARRRADDIAKATGMKIVSVYAVSPVPFGAIQEEFLGRADSEGVTVFTPFGGSSGETSLSTALPKVVVRGSVKVIFNITADPKRLPEPSSQRN